MTPSTTPSRSWFSQISVWVWVFLGILTLGLVLLNAAPQTYPGGSTYEKSLQGYSQWYAALAERHSVQRWEQPYDALTGTGQTFIQVADTEPYENENLQNQQILDWVAQGNTLLLLTWEGQISAANFRSSLPSPQGPVWVETRRRGYQSLLPFPVGSDLGEFEAGDIQVELGDAHGAVVWSSPYEKGKVIQSVYPWLGANVYAEGTANLDFLTNLVTQQDGTIWVDEWLHGHRQTLTDDGARPDDASAADAFAYLRQQPIGVAFGQGVILLLLLIWGLNQRLGAPRSLVPAPVNNSDRYIQSLADTLQHSNHQGYVLKLLGQAFRQRLAAALGLATTLMTDQAIAQQWSVVTGRPPQDLIELLEQTQPQKTLSDRALLDWVRSADHILRGLS